MPPHFAEAVTEAVIGTFFFLGAITMNSRRPRPHLISLALMVLSAQAQSQSPASGAPAPQVQRVEVTGTSIKRTDTETASPVLTLTAEEIERSGVTSIAELLRLLPSVSSGGQSDLTSGNGFAAGVSTASLRGFGSTSTLTLINGRRMAATATADPNAGQATLYNVNNIPLAAIERVEVVKDGASAVYGSDAIAGVVNFILKKEYRGLELAARTGGAMQGGFNTRGATLFGGLGDFGKQGFNVMVGVDVFQRDETPIALTRGISFDAWQRTGQIPGRPAPQLTDPDTLIAFSTNFFAESATTANAFSSTPLPPASGRCRAPDVFNTTLLVGGAPACALDLSPYSFWTYPSSSSNIFARATYAVTPDITASAEIGYTKLLNEYGSTAGFAGLSSATSTWFDPRGNRRTFRHVMLANHPDNPLFQANPANTRRMVTAARLGDIPAGSEIEQDSTRVVLDLSGFSAGWDWTTGVLLNKSTRKEIEKGLINSVTAQQGLNQYRFGGQNAQQVLDLISPAALSTGETEVQMINARGSREWGKLAGGPIGFAAGLEYRKESIQMNPDPNLDVGNFVGRGGSKANGARNVASAYVEANLPVMKALSIEAAARMDEYSDYGNSLTPKLGFVWKPTSSLSVRGTAADGFRAPALTQISESSVSSFQSVRMWLDTVRCPKNSAGVSAQIPGATGYEANECNSARAPTRTLAAFIVANKDLQPETSRSYTLGLVFAPTTQLSGTLDLYEISRKNEIDRLSSDNVMERFFQNGETVYASNIFRNSDPTTALRDASGNLIPGTEPVAAVQRRFLNLGQTIVRGVDLELTHRFTFAESAKASNSLYIGYVKDFLFQRDKGGPFTQLADTALGSNNPKFKARFSSSITAGEWTVSGAVNYTHSFAVPSVNTTLGTRIECNTAVASNPVLAAELGDCRVSSYTTVDASISYRPTKNLVIQGNLRNAFNRQAPFDPSYTYYNTIMHSPAGATYGLTARYTFD